MEDPIHQRFGRIFPSIQKYRRGILFSLAGVILCVPLLLLSPSLFSHFFNKDVTSPFFQTTAVVGHGGDNASRPSYFLAFNLKGHAVVIELEGSDPTKAMEYTAPLNTSLNSKDTVAVAFSDVTGDDKPDMLVYLNQDFKYVFVNDGLKFRQSTARDVINQKNLPIGLSPKSNFPIIKSSAVVGHGGDNASRPSYFLTLNFQRHVIILEFKASDPSSATIYVTSGYLSGKGGDQVSATLEFRDINDDGKADMVVHIPLPHQSQLLFINDGRQFRPVTGSDKF